MHLPKNILYITLATQSCHSIIFHNSTTFSLVDALAILVSNLNLRFSLLLAILHSALPNHAESEVGNSAVDEVDRSKLGDIFTNKD